MTNQKDETEGMWESLGLDDLNPDDPNYAHRDTLKKMEQLYNDLPEGWTRNTDLSKSKAPYVHVSGKESFRHPNRPLMQKLVDEMNETGKDNHAVMKKRGVVESAALRSQRKKLRLMLQAGLPMAAVEQKAKLHGIDMSSVLEERNEGAVEKGAVDDDMGETTIPAPLIKKYKRMIKSGVPLMGVQAQASVDGGGRWTPEEVADILADVLDSTNAAHSHHYMPRHKLPRRKASNPDEALALLENAAANAVEAFSCDGSKVSFAGKSNLAALVRKMAQTVQKRSSTSMDATMIVDDLTLYNALGALKGVQTSRDRYNSTCNGLGSFQEIKSKRQGFAEIARAIGMNLPKEVSSVVEIDGLDELVNYIEKKYSKELSALKDMLEGGFYDFDSLAVLYPPGSKVVAKNAGGGGVDMVCQVSWNRFEQGRTIMGNPMKYFKVCFHFVVAVGASHATIAEVVEGLEYFEGRRPIQTSLTFVPLAAYPTEVQDRLQARYRRRGEIYNKVALCGKHIYMSYEKGCFFLKRGGSSPGGNSASALATSGRIIVDTQGAYDNGHSLGVGYDPMVMGIKYKYKEYSLHLRALKQGSESDRKSTRHSGDDGLILFEQIPDDMLDMVWPSVVGFSLTAKGWGDVLVDGLEDIQWQEDIFDRLVLPENRKMMVKALVRHSTNSFQDLVQGKGEGTVFLLYGPPGVGKTLTAEAVAELLHKPLYSLSLGTLGTTASELEQRLGQIMTMSAKWDALILLDEADSFLETRSSNASLERNAMVSVMLKLVEYFSGIMFLTSNRVDSLDPAFQTRITLALRYEQLDKDGRTQVWKSLLVKSGFEDDLVTGAIDPIHLSNAALNGREIKNALRLAMAMAAEMEKPLSQKILLETVDIVSDYKKSMASPTIYGMVEDDSEEEV